VKVEEEHKGDNPNISSTLLDTIRNSLGEEEIKKEEQMNDDENEEEDS